MVFFHITVTTMYLYGFDSSIHCNLRSIKFCHSTAYIIVVVVVFIPCSLHTKVTCSLNLYGHIGKFESDSLVVKDFCTESFSFLRVFKSKLVSSRSYTQCLRSNTDSTS